MLVRDVLVLRKGLREFLVRTIMQPLMLVFVLTYVFPKIRQQMMPMMDDNYASILVAGIVALSIVMQGVQSVALPLVAEFGFTREIDDRVMAPVPVWLVAVEKIAAGSVFAAFSALVVFPLAAVIPATPVHINIDWLVLLTVGPLVCILASSAGLACGSFFDGRTVLLLFSVILLPLTFLGAIFFSWQTLDPIPWLKYSVLFNPVVYVSEGMRAALVSQTPHLNLAVIYLALIGFTTVITALGIRSFARRVEIGAENGSIKANKAIWVLVGVAAAIVALITVAAASDDPRGSGGSGGSGANSCPAAVGAVDDAAYVVTVERAPTRQAPFTVRVTRAGQPVSGAGVCLTSVMVGMESMGAGDSARGVGPGRYELAPRFAMRGQWRGTVFVTEPGRAPVAKPLVFNVR